MPAGVVALHLQLSERADGIGAGRRGMGRGGWLG